MLSRSARNAISRQVLKDPYRFRGCLFTKREARRQQGLSTQIKFHLPASTDDRSLVALFDQPSSSSAKRALFTTTGLFGHPSLTHPHAFISLAESTLVRAKLLTERILRARESREELLKVVKNLDRLSDMLCGVIDLAELVRNSHPDRLWMEAANHAYESLCEFMNILNTNVGLYEVRPTVPQL